MNCPDGKLIIEWQYEEEEKQQILGADDYILESEIGKCPTLYHVFGIYFDKNITYCNSKRWWKNSYPLDGAAVVSYQPEVFDGNWAIRMIDGSIQPIRPINQSIYSDKRFVTGEFGFNYRNKSEECINATNYVGGYGVVKTDVIRQDRLLDNCGDCTFKIFQNNQLIFEKITPAKIGCPEVKVYCEEDNCPPGSCKCTHGSIVCCHDGQTGEVIKQFRR